MAEGYPMVPGDRVTVFDRDDCGRVEAYHGTVVDTLYSQGCQDAITRVQCDDGKLRYVFHCDCDDE